MKILLMMCLFSFSLNAATNNLKKNSPKKMTKIIFLDEEVPYFESTTVNGNAVLLLRSQSKTDQLKVSQ
jgi:hypothetical protein